MITVLKGYGAHNLLTIIISGSMIILILLKQRTLCIFSLELLALSLKYYL